MKNARKTNYFFCETDHSTRNCSVNLTLVCRHLQKFTLTLRYIEPRDFACNTWITAHTFLLSFFCHAGVRPLFFMDGGVPRSPLFLASSHPFPPFDVRVFAHLSLSLSCAQELLCRLRRTGARVFTLQYHVTASEGWEASRSCDTEPTTRLYPALPPP